MEKTIVQEIHNEKLKFLALSLLGGLLIHLGALIKIPMYPVPYTLQTLAISILALIQSPQQAFASVCCYLAFGTAGPSIFLGKCGGYFIAFPIAAYLMAKMRQRYPALIALLCGNALILLLGALWLIPFFGVKIAFTKGAFIFIPSALLKIAAALVFYKWRNDT